MRIVVSPCRYSASSTMPRTGTASFSEPANASRTDITYTQNHSAAPGYNENERIIREKMPEPE
jgi:hypothetical protein